MLYPHTQKKTSTNLFFSKPCVPHNWVFLEVLAERRGHAWSISNPVIGISFCSKQIKEHFLPANIPYFIQYTGSQILVLHIFLHIY